MSKLLSLWKCTESKKRSNLLLFLTPHSQRGTNEGKADPRTEPSRQRSGEEDQESVWACAEHLYVQYVYCTVFAAEVSDPV